MDSKTWFIPPGTTFTPDGIIRLGTVIKDFRRPTLVLLEPEALALADPKFSIPPIQIVPEKDHKHSRSLNSSGGGGIWAKFLDLASASLRLELARRYRLDYSSVDHDIHQFKRYLTPEALEAIVNQPAVRQHMDTGLYGKRPVYIVSGLRVTKTGMTVTMEKGYTRTGGVSAGVSGMAPTAPGIIFAYSLHVIREKGAGNVESEIFSRRTSFMTGIGEEDVEIELAEVLLEDLLEDPEEDTSDLVKHNIGQDTCISFAPSREA
ncbi:hypothetical protein Trihar35433_10821 [Trichoderma harzianum]|nr:hypothetical protein Trihar35433_10821 [Trichoderma harzianum]